MPSRSTLIRGWAFRRSGWGAVHPWCHLGDPWPPVRLSLHAHAFSQRLGSAHRVAHGGGLVGLHARQAGDPGYSLLGTVGFVLASVGDLLLATLGPFVYSAVPGSAFPFMMVMFVYVVAAWWGDDSVGGGHPARGSPAAALEGFAVGLLPPGRTP